MNNLKLTVPSLLVIFLWMLTLGGCKDKSNDSHEAWELSSSTQIGRKPVWSHDGWQILFGDDTPGSAGLYLWDLNSDPVLLHEELPAHNWDYCWSADGSGIAFSSPGGADDSLAGIWVYTFADNTLSQVYNYGRDVSWLFNNNELLFRIDNHGDDQPGIYRISINGDEEPSLLIENGHRPACSPQYDFIAYSDNEIDGKLHIVDLDMQEAYLSQPGAVHWNWSYDGYNLAYIANDYTGGTLSEVMWGVDLSHPENADTLSRWATYPACDQTAQQVAFVRVQTGRVAGLWLHRKGVGEHRITSYGQNPSFCPIRDQVAANSAGGGIRIFTRIS